MSDSATQSNDSTGPDDHATNNRDGIGVNVQEYGKHASTVVMLLGIWILIATFFESPDTALLWSNFIVGIALLLVSTYNRSRRESMQIGRLPYASLVILLGLWLLLTPTVVGTATTGTTLLYWSHLIVGGLSIVFGGYSAYCAYQHSGDQTPG